MSVGMTQLAERIDTLDKKMDAKINAVEAKVDRLTKNLRDVIFLLIGLLFTVAGAVVIALLDVGGL